MVSSIVSKDRDMVDAARRKEYNRIEYNFIHSNHISWYIEDHSFTNTYIEHD